MVSLILILSFAQAVVLVQKLALITLFQLLTMLKQFMFLVAIRIRVHKHVRCARMVVLAVKNVKRLVQLVQ